MIRDALRAATGLPFFVAGRICIGQRLQLHQHLDRIPPFSSGKYPMSANGGLQCSVGQVRPVREICRLGSVGAGGG
jgi:hypothetical protein